MRGPTACASLLGRSSWSADALRDHVRDYAVDALGDPAGVLVVDETGFLKKGTHSVGVARQYSGTAGRIENCQIGVFACYASRWGQAIETTGSFTCPRPGQRILSAARVRMYQTTSPFAPSRRSRVR